MGKFKFEETKIKGLCIITPTLFGDERGYFTETYQKEEFKIAGIDVEFVQDNESKSSKGVLRGLHFQKSMPQGKLVRVIDGEVFDVAVDLRENSDTYGEWFGIYLSSKNKRQLYIPEGFAHGFLTVSEQAIFVYKCTRIYAPNDEGGLAYDSPELGINWEDLVDCKLKLSDKDKLYPTLSKLNFKF